MKHIDLVDDKSDGTWGKLKYILYSSLPGLIFDKLGCVSAIKM